MPEPTDKVQANVDGVRRLSKQDLERSRQVVLEALTRAETMPKPVASKIEAPVAPPVPKIVPSRVEDPAAGSKPVPPPISKPAVQATVEAAPVAPPVEKLPASFRQEILAAIDNKRPAPALSHAEGPVLSRAEGPIPSKLEVSLPKRHEETAATVKAPDVLTPPLEIKRPPAERRSVLDTIAAPSQSATSRVEGPDQSKAAKPALSRAEGPVSKPAAAQTSLWRRLFGVKASAPKPTQSRPAKPALTNAEGPVLSRAEVPVAKKIIQAAPKPAPLEAEKHWQEPPGTLLSWLMRDQWQVKAEPKVSPGPFPRPPAPKLSKKVRLRREPKSLLAWFESRKHRKEARLEESWLDRAIFYAESLLHYLLLIAILAILLYLGVAAVIMKTDTADPVALRLADIIELPAAVAPGSFYSYSEYQALKQELSSQFAGDGLKRALRSEIARRLVVKKLWREYGLPAASLEYTGRESLLADRMVYDQRANQVPLSRIAKIQDKVRRGEDFMATAARYGDEQGFLTFATIPEAVDRFGDAARLEIGAVSTVIATKEAYYLLKRDPDDQGQPYYSYALVKAKSLDSYLDELLRAQRLWSFVEL